MSTPRAAWALLVASTIACSSGVSELATNRDTHVSQAQAAGFCDAFAVIQQKCERCHADPPQHGAPFPLDSYEATQVPSRDGKTIRADRMRAVIDSGFMPPTTLDLDPPVEPLSCEEKATLLQWLDLGAAPPPNADPECKRSPTSLQTCGAAGTGGEP